MEKNIDFSHVADLYDYYTNVDFDIAFFKIFDSRMEQRFFPSHEYSV